MEISLVGCWILDMGRTDWSLASETDSSLLPYSRGVVEFVGQFEEPDFVSTSDWEEEEYSLIDSSSPYTVSSDLRDDDDSKFPLKKYFVTVWVNARICIFLLLSNGQKDPTGGTFH